MAEKTRNGKGAVGRIFLVLGVVLLMAIVYVSAILLQIPEDETDNYVVVEEPEPITRMQPATMNAESGMPLDRQVRDVKRAERIREAFADA